MASEGRSDIMMWSQASLAVAEDEERHRGGGDIRVGAQPVREIARSLDALRYEAV